MSMLSLALFFIATVVMLINLFTYVRADNFEDKVLSLIWVAILTVMMYGVQP